MGLARHGQLRPLNKAGAHGRITETCLKEKEGYPIGEGWMIRSIGTNQRARIGCMDHRDLIIHVVYGIVGNARSRIMEVETTVNLNKSLQHS